MAAASIGQVHHAILNDGRNVIVKVQRPGIRKQIIDDLHAFEDGAKFLKKHSQQGRNVMLRTTLEEFRKAALRELDFRNEVQNLKNSIIDCGSGPDDAGRNKFYNFRISGFSNVIFPDGGFGRNNNCRGNINQ